MMSWLRYGLLVLLAIGSHNAMAACDVSFGSIPSYSCSGPFPETGTYVITNNSPKTLPIAVSLKINDNQPAGNVSITANTCGSTLASQATCSVTVTMTSIGPYNRVLQVTTGSGRQATLNSPIITPTVGCSTATGTLSPSFTGAPLNCSLLSLTNVAVLAGTPAITNVGNTVINGNLDEFPSAATTGFTFSTPPGPGVVNGTVNLANTTANIAQTDSTTLNNCLAVPACTATITGDMAGQTFTSTGVGAVNVLCAASTALTNSGTFTLTGDANSVFIIRASSTATSLTMNPGSSIALTGGLTAANIFWQLGGSAAISTTVVFKGTIIAATSITMANGDTDLGRLLAQTGQVTFINDSVTLP